MIRPVGPCGILGLCISNKLPSDTLVTGSGTTLITHSGEHPFSIQGFFGTYLFIFTFRPQSKLTERVPCQCFVKCQMVRKLSCRSPSCKPCTCPASRLQKKPRISDRDIIVLIAVGSYLSKEGSRRDTPQCAADNSQDVVAGFTTWGGGSY